MEKVNEARFIFQFFLLNFCKLNNNLSVTLKSLSLINFLKPVKPKLSNNKRSFLERYQENSTNELLVYFLYL